MKKLLLLVPAIFSLANLYSQNLTIDDLVSLRKKSLGNVEEILSIKGWTFLNGGESNWATMESANFAFNKQDYSDDATSFLELAYDNTEKEEICNHQILFQFFDVVAYTNYIKRLKVLGCNLIKTEIQEGNIIKIYQGKTTTFKISIISDKRKLGITKTRYHFLILGNEYYFGELAVTAALQHEINKEYMNGITD